MRIIEVNLEDIDLTEAKIQVNFSEVKIHMVEVNFLQGNNYGQFRGRSHGCGRGNYHGHSHSRSNYQGNNNYQYHQYYGHDDEY